MITGPVTINLRVSVKWWVRHYVALVSLFATLHGMEPDHDKIGRFIARHGIKIVAGA